MITVILYASGAGYFYGVTAVILKHLRRINQEVKNLDQLLEEQQADVKKFHPF